MKKKVSASVSRVGTEEFTYGLSNGESGNKRKDCEGLHDDHGERKGRGGAAAKERLRLFVI